MKEDRYDSTLEGVHLNSQSVHTYVCEWYTRLMLMAEELSLNLERCPRVYFMALNDSLSLSTSTTYTCISG